VVIKIVRIFNTYGPRMQPNDGRVVSNFIMQALKNEDITIYGDGSQTRSFQYIDDLLAGMTRFMGTSDDITGPLNMGNENEFSIKELAEMVIDMTNSRSKITYLPLPENDPVQRKPDTTYARELLDWQAKVSLREGLMPTIAYFENLLRR